MRNTLLLIKRYSMSFLASIVKKRKNAKYITAVIIFLAFSALLVLAFTISAISSVKVFLDIKDEYPGVEKLAMYNSCSMSMMIVFLLTIMRSAYPKREMNADMFLSLPLKKSEIIASKVFYYYIFDLLTIMGIVLPSFLVYAVMVPNVMSVKIAIALRGLLLVVIIPFFTNAIASLISTATNKILSKVKYQKVFQTLILLFVISIYIVVYTLMQMVVGKVSEGQNVAEIEAIFNNIWPIKIMASFILEGKITSLLWIVLISIIPFILSTYLMIRNYGKSITHAYHNKNKTLVFKKNNPVKTLYIKEIKYYFSIPVYVLNTLIGAVMYLGIGIVIKVLGLNKILLYLRSLSSISPSISSHPEMIIVLLFSLIITLTVTTAASISLEGKQFWIVKAIPVNPIHLFIAKILVNLTITIIPVLVSTPLLASVIGWKYTWMIFLIPMLSSIFSAIAGLYVNIMYPKLDWENEEIPLKRSIASFLGTFVGGLIMVVPFVAYLAGLYTLFSTFQYAVIVVGYQLLFIAFVTTLLVTRGVKYFNKISI